MSEPLVRMERITKSYGSVRALTDVSLEVREREIVGLLGDNGAGKSTLIKILSGAIPATSGDIFIRGRKVEIRGTTDAIANGIETIYQDSALVTQLSIARNLAIDVTRTRRTQPADPELIAAELALETATPAADEVDPPPDEREQLRRAIAELPPDQRRALVLAAYLGWTAREISELDGLPLGTVKTRIRSAMLKLRARLEAER